MSEKRYEVGYDDECNPLYVYDNKSDSTYNLSRVVNLLNAFDRECTDLLEENEQLKQENEQLRKRNHEILKELYCKECCDNDE